MRGTFVMSQDRRSDRGGLRTFRHMEQRTRVRIAVFLTGLGMACLAFGARGDAATLRTDAKPTDVPCARALAASGPDGRAPLHVMINTCRSEIGGPNA